MNLKTKLAVAWVALTLCFTGSAMAMSFDDFGRLNNDDEAGYIAFLIDATAQMLKANGRPDQADKVVAYFHDASNSGGVHELASNIRMFNGMNKRNAINPNNRASVYQIEDALSVTLKEVGIVVPAAYLLTAGQNFRPLGPPRSHINGNGQ